MEKFRFVVDSCCEVTEDFRGDMDVVKVPFFMTLDGVDHVDDENLDEDAFLKIMADSPNCPKSGCPAPFAFTEQIDPSINTFIITLSSKLSACYESAMKAREEILEKNPNAKIHVFDSLSASSGELNVFLKAKDLIEQGLSFEEIVQKTESYIKNMKTLFVLEDLSILIKNGRMSKVAGAVANLLSICPVMCAKDGEIEVYQKALGIKKALNKLVTAVGEVNKTASDFKDKILVITHCNNFPRANDVRQKMKAAYDFKDVIINKTKGLSTMYANDGGIIIAF